MFEGSKKVIFIKWMFRQELFRRKLQKSEIADIYCRNSVIMAAV